jgi:6,7-dimethyl-8-ribityllumazine synthase
MDLTLEGYAIGNGILTVENEAQAIARADPAQLDKGGGAARAAIDMVGITARFGAAPSYLRQVR